MIFLQIEHLRKKFDQVEALKDVNLKIGAGEIFFLLGSSGCGKTTLLRHIAGFYRPDEGRILFDQEDVTHVPPHQRETAMMFQSYALWPHLTVYGNVAFGLEERKVGKAEIQRRVREVLRMVKLEGLENRRIHQLSGGQQQRVALARALVIEPKCLLLDEPLSNLDAKLRIEMRQEIRRICKLTGLTAVYVTHDQKEALSMADRLAVMDQGRILQVGTPWEVYRSPRHSVVADFIGETNLIEGSLLHETGEGWRVHTEMGIFLGKITHPDWQPAPGERVLLSIRPECWKLAPQEELQGENVLKGMIVESTYLGEVAQSVIQWKLASGEAGKLKVSEMNPIHMREVSSEMHVFSVSPEDVIILKD